MADITITKSNVAKVAGDSQTAISGDTITAGQGVYIDTSDSNKVKRTDADAAASAVIAGIALNDALSGQPVTFQTSGTITVGGTVVVAEIYIVSTAAGGIAPEADITTTGDYVSIFGIGTTSTIITLNFQSPGVTIP